MEENLASCSDVSTKDEGVLEYYIAQKLPFVNFPLDCIIWHFNFVLTLMH